SMKLIRLGFPAAAPYREHSADRALEGVFFCVKSFCFFGFLPRCKSGLYELSHQFRARHAVFFGPIV
ncbi:MAG TPA: hypothetical protein VIJ85_01950, partial [Rhizomicrobium sp.]